MAALIRDIWARQSMLKVVLEDDEDTESLDFIGSHAIEDGKAKVLEALQGLLYMDLATFRAKTNAAGAFDLLRESVEMSGVFVLLKGDLGNYHSRIDVSVFRGFSIADEIAPFIVINDQDAKPAWSFTILHEMVHLLLGQTSISGEYGDSEVERFCDDIASEFLLPASDLSALSLKEPSNLDTVAARISDFANERNVSRSLVALRANRAGLISQEIYRNLISGYRQRWQEEQERLKESGKLKGSGPSYYVVRRHRLGRRIRDVVERLLDNNELSLSRAARILGVKPLQVQPLLSSGSSH